MDTEGASEYYQKIKDDLKNLAGILDYSHICSSTNYDLYYYNFRCGIKISN